MFLIPLRLSFFFLLIYTKYFANKTNIYKCVWNISETKIMILFLKLGFEETHYFGAIDKCITNALRMHFIVILQVLNVSCEIYFFVS